MIITATAVLTVFGAQPSRAQTKSVKVPAQQRELSNIHSRYELLELGAPNTIQRDRIEAQHYKEFCAKIPSGNVSGWIGEVEQIDNGTPDKGIQLWLSVATLFLNRPGGLSLGNFYGYGVDRETTQPHEPTLIPVGSPLYEIAANLTVGDTVRFSGTFIPYASPEACYRTFMTYFSLVRFTSIQRIGWGLVLQ